MDLSAYEPTMFGRAERTRGTHSYVAYFPHPIPRDIEMSPTSIAAMADAEAALGRLAGAVRMLPNPQLMIGPYLRREAVASTRIEGTQASLSDVYDAEASGERANPDVEEVMNYVRAMEQGLARLDTLPFSLRLIRELHREILAGVRGSERSPGELRTTQNWIGAPGATIESATFVPPPPTEIGALLDDLESFAHDDSVSPLLQAALIHYQFETIHPFLDGNGRLGRLIVVFLLVMRQRLPGPLLYISPYLERRRAEYYAALQGVRERGDLEGWLALFFAAVATQATDAVDRAERLVDLREHYRRITQDATRGSANALVDVLFEQPVVTARIVEERLEISRPSALAALRQLADLGVLKEAGDGRRGQLRWRAADILAALTEDELPRP